MTTTIGNLLERAGIALQGLATTGEEIAEEWQYVTDLLAVGQGRLGQVAAARGAEPADDATVGAFDAAIAEAGLVTDPHRAIDWLSTLPQVVLLSIGESA